jgi:acyl-coenzyme A synthetase/AMP-(fatty) acid ligase
MAWRSTACAARSVTANSPNGQRASATRSPRVASTPAHAWVSSRHSAATTSGGVEGVLAAGAVAVPLDATAPPRRQAALLRTSACVALIHDDAARPTLAATLADLTAPGAAALVTLELDADGRLVGSADGHLPDAGGSRADSGDHQPAEASSLACVLHTSGSTGTPKAVPIGWDAHDVFVSWMMALTDLGAGDRILRTAELTFDLAWFDHLAAWRAGATLCTASRREMAAAGSLFAAIDRLAPSVVYGVPSLFAKLLTGLDAQPSEWRSAPRVICFAGEVFPPPLLAELARRAPETRFYNLFGPTETNVCTYHAVDRGRLDGVSELPIGVACPYADCRLVDEQGHTLEGPGVGELVVRGPTALGGEHATRDCVERRADGLFYFRGRLDRVVKIRGYRVDPTEVEMALMQLAEVREAAVIVVDHPRLGPELAGYAAGRDGPLDARWLRQRLSETLPPHLVPRTIAVLNELPRTATGKIDYRALAS